MIELNKVHQGDCLEVMKQTPKLFVSPLTNRIYIGLSYHENPDGSAVCSNKVDVTEQFIEIMKDYEPYVRDGKLL